MLTRFSRPELSSSLERRTGEAFDRAMRRSIKLNRVAEFTMDRMDGTRPISRIAAEVSAEFGIPENVAIVDTISFTEALRGYDVVSIGPPAGRSLRPALLSTLVSGWPIPRRWASTLASQRRVDVRGASFVGILAQVAPVVSVRLLSLAGLLALLVGWAAFALTNSVLDAVLVASGASFALVLGVSLHESAHLYALRRCTGDENLGYMMVTPLQISISHPNLRSEKNFRVAVSGPLCPLFCGVAMYCVNVFYSNPLIVTCALLLVAHAMSYVPVAGSDGMNILSYAGGGRGEPRPDGRGTSGGGSARS